MRRSLVALVGSLLLFTGCAPNVSYAPMNTSPTAMARRPVSEVQVFHTRVPERPYVEVALIEAQAEELASHSPDEVFSALREEAARRGCEGLIVGGGGGDAVSGYLASDVGYVESLKAYQATCIVYAP